MKIENISIDKLIPYEFNNKIHDETQINRIANSIKEFGFTQPVVIDKDNVIVIGHGRVEGAKKIGIKYVPCVVVDKLTDKQIKKLRILDNKLNESEWNFENLKIELDDLGDFNFGDLEYSILDIFPEFNTDNINPDKNNDEEESLNGNSPENNDGQVKVIVYVKDEAEASLLKDDLKNLGYTNFK